MQRLKIVFSGPMGAGKTQAISSLSDIPVVSTEVMNTDLDTNAKLLTTVGMDYGELTVDGGAVLDCMAPQVRSVLNLFGPFYRKVLWVW